MSEHTPTEGQWLWERWRASEDDAPAIVTAHGIAIAMRPRYTSREQWEADAPVLAAAKDMLAVLRSCLSDYGHPNFTDRHGMADRLRKIIAKAEGRQP